MLGGLISSMTNSKEMKEAKADNLTTIGVLYKVQHVSSTTKVYISLDDISLITGAGREVHSELYIPPLNGGGSEIENIGGDGLDHINPPIVRYYYYADLYNPIIKSKKTMYNDYESLVYAIEYLEDEFSYHNPNANIKNAVLAYIRGINKNYYTKIISIPNVGIGINYFNIVCGSNNVAYILDLPNSSSTNPDLNYSFIECYNVVGLKIREYFASFLLEDNTFDSSLYGTCSDIYLSKHLKLVNPSTNSADIDLIHLFASMDGIFKKTQEATNIAPFNIVSQNVYRYLVSWAGDLQDSAKKYFSNNNVPPANMNTIFDGNYYFDIYDLYADLDATNMAFNVDLDEELRNISDIVDDYYSGFDSSFSREILFCQKIAYARYESNIFNFDDFKYVVYMMMNLNLDGTQFQDTILIESRIAYYFLYVDDILGFNPGMVTISNRLTMANLFCDYFFNLLTEI